MAAGSTVAGGHRLRRISAVDAAVTAWTIPWTGVGCCIRREDADQVGPFVLSYAGSEQQLTSAKARAAYAGEVRELLAG